MDDRMFRLMLDWFMVSDPWPLDQEGASLVEFVLNEEALRRDHVDWLDAYHGFRVEAVEAVG